MDFYKINRVNQLIIYIKLMSNQIIKTIDRLTANSYIKSTILRKVYKGKN